MPNNELKAVVTADTKDFNSNMSKIGVTANVAAKSVTLAIGAATTALFSFAFASKEAAKQAESQRVQLIGLFRDVAKGTKEFDKLQKVADESALVTNDLIESYLALGREVGADTAAKDFADIMEDIGFASKQGSGSMTDAATAIGRLIGRFELFGKIDQDTLDTLKRTSGVSNEFIKSLQKMDKATLTTNKLIAMTKKELQASAKVMKQEYANSVEGLEALLGGKLSQAFRTAGEDSDSYKNLLIALTELMDKVISSGVLEELGKELGKLFDELATLAKDEGTLQYVKDLADAFILLSKGIKLSLKPLESFTAARSGISAGNTAARQIQLAELLTNLRQQGIRDPNLLIALREQYGGAAGKDLGSIEKVQEFKSLLQASRTSSMQLGQQGTAVWIVDPKTGNTWDVDRSNKSNKVITGE
jgi:hypothetical protein